jgi:RHS repeat-associated protein
MDGCSRDAAGHLLSDGAHHYSYDAEGRRVRRTIGTFVHDLLYDLGGHAMTEMEFDSSFNGWTRGEIYAGGRHLATYVDSTTYYFDYGDWLGTERLRTRLDGTVYETCISLPFGDAQNCTFPNGAGTNSPLHFTGKPRDAETVLDDFGFRYNSTTLGRFMTPDLAGTGFSSLSDPQSWNLYSYAVNDPVTFIDPDGHECVRDDGSFDSKGDP